MKTKVIRKNVNPEWNEELTLSVEDCSLPVRLVSICYFLPTRYCHLFNDNEHAMLLFAVSVNQILNPADDFP